MIDRLATELRTVYARTHRRDPDDLAGLDTRHRFHDLRHTFATHMAAIGVPCAPSNVFGREARGGGGDVPLRLVEG
jgi:integrase